MQLQVFDLLIAAKIIENRTQNFKKLYMKIIFNITTLNNGLALCKTLIQILTDNIDL